MSCGLPKNRGATSLWALYLNEYPVVLRYKGYFVGLTYKILRVRLLSLLNSDSRCYVMKCG